MTYTEQYNQYVKECIKERPAFGGPYEDYYLEFDEWIDNYIIEFVEWCLDNNQIIQNDGKELLEIYKKEKNL